MPLYGEQSVSHRNMFAFLGHLQRTTVDSQADVNRLSRGMTIRRAKKRKYIINDTRILYPCIVDDVLALLRAANYSQLFPG